MIFPRLFVSDDFLPFVDLVTRFGTRTRVKKNTVLRDANGTHRTSYFILNGVARLSYINEEGTEGTFFFFGRGSIYPINNSEEMLTTENYLQFVSVTDLDVIRFPAQRIRAICSASPKFCLAVIDHYVRYTNVLITKQLLNSYNDSTQLISALLLLYVSEKPDNDLVDLSQEDIAQITGLSRTQVTRVLAVLRNNNVIQTSRGQLQIIDIETLRNRYTRMNDLI